MKIKTLEADQLDTVLNRIPASFKQGIRFVEHLAKHPRTATVEANSTCAIGNLSDVAHKVNPYLYLHGLMIGCEKPVRPIKNRFNEPSNMYLWSLYEVQEAANDADGSAQ